LSGANILAFSYHELCCGETYFGLSTGVMNPVYPALRCRRFLHAEVQPLHSLSDILSIDPMPKCGYQTHKGVQLVC
jgi:hypothetical protein